MALTPVKMLWPIRLDVNGSAQGEYSFVVEDRITTAKAVFDPMLRFYNTNTTGNINLTITHTLDLGFGDDPLYSGSWTFEVVNEDIPPITLRDYRFTPQIDLDTVAATRHTVKVTNLSLTEQKIVRLILFGTAEIEAQLPASQQIVRAATV